MENNFIWDPYFIDEMDSNNNSFEVEDAEHPNFFEETAAMFDMREYESPQRSGFIFKKSTLLVGFITFCLLLQISFAKNLDNSRFGDISSFSNDEASPERPHLYEPKFKRDHHHAFTHHDKHFQPQQQPHSHLRRLQRDSSGKECKNVESYFAAKQVQMRLDNEQKGAICGGNCCSNSTETELKLKATTTFEDSLHHHTESLRNTLKSTAELFENHILEIFMQSKNNSLKIISTVFKREPISRQLIINLYSEIINHLRMKNFGVYEMEDLEKSINQFFINLFPVAYHHAVYTSHNRTGELHEDYINCLKHAYEDLRPFGDIPKETRHSLINSIQRANIFMNALLQSAEVLGEIDQFYGMYLSENCKDHLLKMNYCQSCHGYHKKQAKPCYSYCMNVLRGCSAQFIGVLDSPWSNVAEGIANLDQHIRTDDAGIVSTIRKLSNKLSDSIMDTLKNEGDLEKKVRKTCGTPKLLPSREIEQDVRLIQQHGSKVIPLDAGIINYLSTIHKSKEFYSNIVMASCEAESSENRNKDCWTGDRLGEYTQLLMQTGRDTQRYNPEVPLEPNSQSIKLNEMADKLLKIRKNIGIALPQQPKRIYSDFQNDMGKPDEEGSGGIADDADDEEFGIRGSGSGDDSTPSPFDIPGGTTNIARNDVGVPTSKATTHSLCLSTLIATILLVTIQFSLA